MRVGIDSMTLIAVGAFGMWGATLVPPAPPGETWAGVVPMGASLMLAVTGFVLALDALRAGVALVNPVSFDKKSLRILGLFGLSVLYCLGIVYFGYELSTALVTVVVFWMFGVRRPRTLLLSMLLYPLIFHVIFFTLLGVYPPRGQWFNLAEFLGA